EGALAGAIIAIEILKAMTGIRGSTGLRFVASIAAAIAIGRIGCLLAGLDDMTYGTPTNLPWGIDFGDGVRRHPVQLYESITMALFFAVFVILVHRGNEAVLRTAFYLFVGVYAAQRFSWEFLKPYGTVIGPFNLFHLLSIALITYAFLFARREAPRPCGTLEALPRFSEAGRCAVQISHPHRQGMSLRLRSLPRSRAAQLPGADRNQRALQPDLPDLFRQLFAVANWAPPAHRNRAHA